jgi:HK97 gp10 family phage protein
MQFSMRFEGGDELARALDSLPLAVSKSMLLAALREAAEPVRARAEQLAVVGSVAPHLNDNVVIQTVTRVGSIQGGAWATTQGEPWVAVGPAKQFFYGIFLEYGTVHMGARSFMRPAFDSSGSLCLSILAAKIWDALDRRAQRQPSIVTPISAPVYIVPDQVAA